MRKLLLLLAGIVTMTCLPGKLLSQNSSITGTITDAAGRPIVGTTILIRATTRGTSTDADGKFQLSGDVKNGLVISALEIGRAHV